jgi:hypothetical protein
MGRGCVACVCARERTGQTQLWWQPDSPEPHASQQLWCKLRAGAGALLGYADPSCQNFVAAVHLANLISVSVTDPTDAQPGFCVEMAYTSEHRALLCGSHAKAQLWARAITTAARDPRAAEKVRPARRPPGPPPQFTRPLRVPPPPPTETLFPAADASSPAISEAAPSSDPMSPGSARQILANEFEALCMSQGLLRHLSKDHTAPPHRSEAPLASKVTPKKNCSTRCGNGDLGTCVEASVVTDATVESMMVEVVSSTSSADMEMQSAQDQKTTAPFAQSPLKVEAETETETRDALNSGVNECNDDDDEILSAALPKSKTLHLTAPLLSTTANDPHARVTTATAEETKGVCACCMPMLNVYKVSPPPPPPSRLRCRLVRSTHSLTVFAVSSCG